MTTRHILLLLISLAWSTPPGEDGPGPCYIYLNPRIVIQCSNGDRHASPAAVDLIT